jgi:hypothetical protein
LGLRLDHLHWPEQMPHTLQVVVLLGFGTPPILMLHTLMESQCLLYLDNRINTVMAYTLNLTSSPALVTVTDETLDNTYALTFVGRNRGEWGEVVNENFLRLMENFASSTPPSTSVEGQLHYDMIQSINLWRCLMVWRMSSHQ